MIRRSALSPRLLIVAAIGALAVFSFGLWRATRALHSAANDVRSEQQIRFFVRPLQSAVNFGFESISSPDVFLQATKFNGHVFVAGPAGLFEYDPTGGLRHEYLVGRDLPGSPLIALTSGVLADSRQSELIVATGDEGVLAFNGRSFRQILPVDPDARAATAVLATAAGHLLIGTKKRGVLIYDGHQISAFHTTTANTYVTALAGDDSDLWVGTLNSGVLHFHAGRTDIFSEDQGLPDRQVTSLAVSGDKTYVGTPLGVAEFFMGRSSRLLAAGFFATALLPAAQDLYVGSEDQGVIAIALEGRRPNPNFRADSDLNEVHQLFASDESVFALTRGGLYRMQAHGFGWQPVLQANPGTLNDRNVSALASDLGGRLWIGYFDRGLDVLPADGGHALHVEDQHVFCVNRIFPNSKTGGIDVATANGLVRFDTSGKEQQTLTRADGLIADHITDVAAYGDGLALATPAGLTFLDATGARSMYAFHGLVNNHVYALGVAGEELFAGTLGGVSLLEKGTVAVNYTTSNSNLKHNWITAAVPVGDEWMVGTYGAGVLSLDRSGHFHSFDIGSGNFEVNPNAMLVTPGYVLAGTLGKGLYVWDRATGRWSVIEQGLPSLNVTALSASGGFIYVGTDNGLVRIAEHKLHS